MITATILDQLSTEEQALLSCVAPYGYGSNPIDLARIAERVDVSYSFVESSLVHLAKLGLLVIRIDADGWRASLLVSPPPFVKAQIERVRPARPSLPSDVRWFVWERDDFRCRECPARRDLTIDHVIAVVNGGTDDPSNLQTLCRSCNSRKGTR